MNISSLYKLNIENCDTEPIHLIGKIQSHGYLLAFDRESYTLEFISENVRSLFSDNILDTLPYLKHLFGNQIFNEVKKLVQSRLKSVLSECITEINGKEYQVFISYSDSNIILELELFNSLENSNYWKELLFVENFLTDLQQTQSVRDLVTNIAISFRNYTGFDRVMVYELDEKGDGEVIAEDKKFGLDSFLGFKYPASDIPKQARALYLTNLIRSLNDVNDVGINIISLTNSANQLDLSHSIFRGISPIHIQYLKNMGVKATYAISIIVDNRLWGLIICHHHEAAKHLNFNKRLASLLIGNTVSQAIGKLETIERKNFIHSEKLILDKIRFSKQENTYFERVLQNWDSISNLINSDGFALISRDDIKFTGHVPSEDTLRKISNLYCKANKSEVNSTNNLLSINPELYSNNIAGLLNILISEELEEYLIFFRKEQNQVVNWAGNPYKAVEVDNSTGIERLSPRGSFALWQENVDGQSIPWHEKDIVFVTNLRETLIAKEIGKLGSVMIQNEELTAAEIKLQNLLLQRNNELMAMNLLMKQELGDTREYQKILELTKSATEQLNKTKTEFLSNMSHEMRTPINGIMGMAQLIQDDPTISEETRYFADIIIDSSKRLVQTVSRILEMAKLENKKIEYKFEEIHLGKLFDAIMVPLNILANEKKQNLILINHNKEANIVIDELFITQIVTNLATNAIKYTDRNGKIEVNVKIAIENTIKYLIIRVEDNGQGISESAMNRLFEPFFMEAEMSKAVDNSSGLGLYLVKNYVDLLKGTIEVKSVKDFGSIFSVKIPLIN